MSQLEYFVHPRSEMVPFIPASSSRILDVGCGAGQFSLGLKKIWQDKGQELEVWGVELNPEAAATASNVLDHVLSGDVNLLLEKLPAGHFDCIVMNDVIEHIAYPEKLLKNLRPLLNKTGQLVVSIPNVRFFFNVVNLVWHGNWDYTDEGILDRTHLRFFTHSSIVKFLTTCGYKVETTKGINPTGSIKFKLANLLSLGRFSQMQYLQFAIVGRAASTADQEG